MKATTAASVAGDIDENDRIINDIQDLRKRGIAGLMKDGKMPECMEDRAFMIQLMNGATSTALGNKKIKAATQQAASQASMVESIIEVLRINASAAQSKVRKSAQERSAVPKLDPTIVAGHTEQGTRPISTASVSAGGDGYLETSKD